MKNHDSLKPVGTWEVRHRIDIPALVHEADAMVAERTIGSLSGVRKVAVDLNKHQLVVRYDASQTDYQKIVDASTSIGFSPTDNWWSRFKSSWFQFVDTNVRDNAKAPPSPCCNKPPRQ